MLLLLKFLFSSFSLFILFFNLKIVLCINSFVGLFPKNCNLIGYITFSKLVYTINKNCLKSLPSWGSKEGSDNCCISFNEKKFRDNELFFFDNAWINISEKTLRDL